MNTKRDHLFARIMGLAMLLPACVLAHPVVELRLERADLAQLRSLAPEAHADVSLRDTAKAKAEAWSLRRIEVYAEDAQVWVARENGLEPFPRSPLQHYVGTRGGERIVLSLMPDGSQGSGLLISGEGSFQLDAKASRKGLQITGKSLDAPLPDGSRPEADCMGGLDASSASHKISLLPEAASSAMPKAATRRVTLAIDTDNELLQQKFSNNESAANNYLAALVAAMSVIYEKEPGDGGARLQLQQGHTILRPSSTPDPYNQSDPSSALDEFGAHWAGTYSGVSRAFALLISGKAPQPNGAAGIAWILSTNNYCSATSGYGGHYSVSQVFKFAQNTSAQDAPLVAHELGHNFGLDHTHCTGAAGNAPTGSNTLDQCTTFEAGFGCYSGPVSCPSGSPGAPQGTLMSYCHVSTAGCGQNVHLFHPVQVTTLNNRIAAQPSSCVMPLSTPNQAPVITAPGSISVTEDAASPLNGISFADPDAGSGSLTATFTVPTGTLNATSGGGVTVGGTASARTLQGTLSALNSFLGGSSSLGYTTASNANGTVTLGITLNDNGHSGTGGAKTDSENVTLNIAAVNDAPNVSAPSELPVFVVGTAPVSGVSFADVDAAAGSLTVTLNAPVAVTLSNDACAGVTPSGSGNSRTLAGTLSNLNACFASPSKVHMTAPGFTGTGTLSITVNDNGHTGSGGAKSANANVQLRGGILFANGFE